MSAVLEPTKVQAISSVIAAGKRVGFCNEKPRKEVVFDAGPRKGLWHKGDVFRYAYVI